MKSAVVLLLIVAFMALAFLLNKWLQKIIQPAGSFRRLILYFLAVLVSVFIVSFLMVFVITKLYPGELIK